ncbi:hypothetical protein ACP70R_029409 [Stipagrostis hirtigluma subsp. patula]
MKRTKTMFSLGFNPPGADQMGMFRSAAASHYASYPVTPGAPYGMSPALSPSRLALGGGSCAFFSGGGGEGSSSNPWHKNLAPPSYPYYGVGGYLSAPATPPARSPPHSPRPKMPRWDTNHPAGASGHVPPPWVPGAASPLYSMPPSPGQLPTGRPPLYGGVAPGLLAAALRNAARNGGASSSRPRAPGMSSAAGAASPAVAGGAAADRGGGGGDVEMGEGSSGKELELTLGNAMTRGDRA